MTVTSGRRVAALLALLTVSAPAPAQVKYPPRAETVDVRIHYRVNRTDLDQRVRQFRALEAFLKQQGFVPDKRADDDLDIRDPNAEFFSGKVPSKNVLNILQSRSVLTILFAPAGYALPDEPAKPVPVRIGIADGLHARDQWALHGQVVDQLARLGFRQAVGYDNRRFTLVRGDLPAGKVPLLLKDLRLQPEGWFAAESALVDLPQPLRDVLPVRWAEILPDADIPPLAPAPPPPNRVLYTPDLRELVDNPEAANKPLRVELMFDDVPPDFAAAITGRLRAFFGSASVEGVVRNVVTVRFEKPADLDRFVAEVPVAAARLPRAANETAAPLPPGRTPVPVADVLSATRLDKLHALGHRGRGLRVVVIGSEFPGWADRRGKGLPASTRFIDMTAELSPALEPQAPDKNRPGGGTAAALAAALAAPAADFFLVRIDPSAMFEALTVARFAAGEDGYSEAMQARSAEMVRESDALQIRRREVLAEYRLAFQDLSDEEPAAGRRTRAAKARQDLIADERTLVAKSERFVALQQGLRALLGGNVIVLNTLEWEAGYPIDGFSELSRVIDERFAADTNPYPIRFPTRPRPTRPLWVQPASGRVGSAWAGPFLDADQNGAMEFAPPDVPPAAGGWTRELNFLGTVGPDGKAVPNMPVGTKLRITVQWREAHDPEIHPTRDALRPLTVRVLRQLDPAGEKRASDEMQEVARSVGVPVRVRTEPTFGVYEQTVEMTVADGNYAVRIDGPPAYLPPLPALQHQAEIQPRVVAEFVGAAPETGRPVFLTYAPVNAGVGIPGDAMSALAVGGADSPTATASTGLTGGGPGLALRAKPDLLAADAVAGVDQTGPGVAAGFVAGFAASAIGAGATFPDFLHATGLKCGSAAVLPDVWLRGVAPARAPAPDFPRP